jgi:hypothetical protein
MSVTEGARPPTKTFRACSDFIILLPVGVEGAELPPSLAVGECGGFNGDEALDAPEAATMFE